MHYTKGEWKVTKWNKGFGFNVFADEGFVASVPLGTGLIHTMVEAQANAYLISAAPNVYEKLVASTESLVDVLGYLNGGQIEIAKDKIKRIRIDNKIALAKAKGKE